jgi:hypothetical protein
MNSANSKFARLARKLSKICKKIEKNTSEQFGKIQLPTVGKIRLPIWSLRSDST